MRPPHFVAGTLLSVFALCSLSVASLAHTQVAHATGAEQVWLWPVEGEHSIRLEYQAPITEYARGHRGVDLPVDVGQEVLAPATGIVSYAGTLAGRGVLSLRVGDYLVSFEPLNSAVAEGDVVIRGAVLGTVGTGSHCDECMHVGVRRNGLYLSPMKLLESLPTSKLEVWSDEHWASLAAE